MSIENYLDKLRAAHTKAEKKRAILDLIDAGSSLLDITDSNIRNAMGNVFINHPEIINEIKASEKRNKGRMNNIKKIYQ